MKDLSQMTLAQLVELHNKHAAKPVKKFGSEADAVRRTKAVLPAGGRGKTAVTFGDFRVIRYPREHFCR